MVVARNADGTRRMVEAAARGEVEAQYPGGLEAREEALGGGGADAGGELEGAKRGDAVLRVVGPAQDGEEVLHVRGLEELEPAVLHVGDVAPDELELQRVGVVRAAEEHRLALEEHAALARFEHALDHVFALRRVVGDGDVPGLRAGLLSGREVLAEARSAFVHQRVRGVEHRLGGAVVFFEGDGFRSEVFFELQDVFDARRAERIDGLRVVADHREAGAAGAQALQDLRLQHVGVLVLVDQDVVEERARLGGERGVAHHRVPVEEEVVVVERLRFELLVHVLLEKSLQLVFPFRAPGEHLAQRAGERPLRVHLVRVDREAGVLAREALRLALDLGVAELVAHEVHQVRRVAAVEHAEALVEADPRAVPADEAVGDGVKGAGPGNFYN